VDYSGIKERGYPALGGIYSALREIAAGVKGRGWKGGE